MKLDSQDPRRAAGEEVGGAQATTCKLVNPANKRKFTILVVGSGPGRRLGRGELRRARLQREVLLLPGQPAPRPLDRRPGRHQRRQELPERRRQRLPALLRHRSRAATSAPARPTSTAWPRSRVNIIDQCVAQGVPFAREYGGLLDNRSFGGAQVSRTFYARGQTGQQLLLGAYQALCRQIAAGTVDDVPAHRDARPGGRRRPRARHRHARPGRPARSSATPATPWCWRPAATATSSTSRPTPRARNVTAIWRAHRRGALLRQPLLHADPPDLHPGLGRLPVEAHADERVAAQRRPHLGAARSPATRARRARSRRPSATTTSSASTRASATWCRATSPRATPRQVVRRRPRRRAAEDTASTSTSPTPSSASASTAIEERYGNLFEMYEQITGEDPYEVPMRIYPAPHYTMGGLWVDYNLMSNIPGLFVARRGQLLRPRRQPPRRERADAGAGRRLLRPALHHRRLPGRPPGRAGSTPSTAAFAAAEAEVAAARSTGCSSIQRQAHGRLLPPRARHGSMWDYCGMARNADGLEAGARQHPGAARGVLAERARRRRAARSSTRSWRRPAAWPTSSSSPS